MKNNIFVASLVAAMIASGAHAGETLTADLAETNSGIAKTEEQKPASQGKMASVRSHFANNWGKYTALAATIGVFTYLRLAGDGSVTKISRRSGLGQRDRRYPELRSRAWRIPQLINQFLINYIPGAHLFTKETVAAVYLWKN